MARRRKAVIETFECKRCGHRWNPRIPSPALCPHCKTPYWNEPVPHKPRGRPRKNRR